MISLKQGVVNGKGGKGIHRGKGPKPVNAKPAAHLNIGKKTLTGEKRGKRRKKNSRKKETTN